MTSSIDTAAMLEGGGEAVMESAFNGKLRQRYSTKNASDEDESLSLKLEEPNEEEEEFELPESTFTFLITEKVFSVGFATAIITLTLSLTCLFLAFKNQKDEGGERNQLGLPPDVSKEVHATRYLGEYDSVR